MSARPPAVRHRCPEPPGRPASSVKIEDGKSIEVPVWGMVYLVHRTGCAEAIAVETTSANARALIDFIALSSDYHGAKPERQLRSRRLLRWIGSARASRVLRGNHWDRTWSARS